MQYLKKIVSVLLFTLPLSIIFISHSSFAETTKKIVPAPIMFNINQSVYKQPLADGVSIDDAIEAMNSKAIELNMKVVAHQPISKELQARGVKSGRLEIFQFCNPLDAQKMVHYNPVFAAYMPCRIALVEDQKGKVWLMMIDLDLMINNMSLPPDIKKIAVKVSSLLTQIITAAASGEF